MSSFSVEGLGVALGVAVGGTAIAAAAIIASTVGVIAGTGYGAIKAGEAAVREVYKQYQKGVEEEVKREAERKMRLEKARSSHKAVVADACTALDELEKQFAGEALSENAKEAFDALRTTVEEIKNRKNAESAASQESWNSRDGELVEERISAFKSAISLDKESKRKSDQIKKIEDVYKDAVFTHYEELLDITSTDDEAELRKEYSKRLEELAIELKAALERERRRFSTTPVSAVNVYTLKEIFKDADQKVKRLMAKGTSLKDVEEGIKDLEGKIKLYETYRALLDKDGSRFIYLYEMVYKPACDKAGIEAKEMLDFRSPDEIDSEIIALNDKLERMKKCAELYEKYDKEAYICGAVDVEMKRLQGKPVDEKEIERIFDEKYNHADLGENKKSPYYKDGENVMQVYRTKENLLVQVILHKEGYTSLEVISDDSTGDDVVVKKQHEQCLKNAELEKGLRENWFINLNTEILCDEKDVARRFGTRGSRRPTRAVPKTRKDTRAREENLQKARVLYVDED